MNVRLVVRGCFIAILDLARQLRILLHNHVDLIIWKLHHISHGTHVPHLRDGRHRSGNQRVPRVASEGRPNGLCVVKCDNGSGVGFLEWNHRLDDVDSFLLARETHRATRHGFGGVDVRHGFLSSEELLDGATHGEDLGTAADENHVVDVVLHHACALKTVLDDELGLPNQVVDVGVELVARYLQHDSRLLVEDFFFDAVALLVGEGDLDPLRVPEKSLLLRFRERALELLLDLLLDDFV